MVIMTVTYQAAFNEHEKIALEMATEYLLKKKILRASSRFAFTKLAIYNLLNTVKIMMDGDIKAREALGNGIQETKS